jgi:hypothetical protein
LKVLLGHIWIRRTEHLGKIIDQARGTAARFLKSQRVASRRVKSGKSERILVDISKSAIPRTSPGKILRKREAARCIGLSVSVLQALKSGGIFEVNHLLPTRSGFHEQDVEAFCRKLLALAPHPASPKGTGRECVTLRDVMQGHHDCLETKINILRAVLSNMIAIVGNADGTPGGLLLDGPLCRKSLDESRVRAAGNSVTPRRVAEVLGCDRGTIPGLVSMGLLQRSETPGAFRITNESVEVFKQNYVSLVSLTRSDGTSSRSLMKRCENHGINMLLVPTTRKGGPQPFIPIADTGRLAVRAV